MRSFPHLPSVHFLKTLVAIGGLTAALAHAVPPNLAPINPTSTGLQLTGKFTWFDLLTDDVAGAKKFYGPVFGWTFADTPGANGKYSVISVGSERIGGLFHRSKPAKSGPTTRWLSFISVPDPAAAARYAESHGGKLIAGPTSAPARGTHVVLQDPQGALFAVLKSDSGDPIDDPAQTGEFIWADLFVPRPAAAVEFYRGLVGWTSEKSSSRGNAQHLVVSAGGFHRAGLTMLPDGAQQAGWLPYVQVDDVPAALQRVTSAGGKILTTPNRDLLNGNLAVVSDPNGGVIGIVKWTGSGKNGRRK